MSSELTIPCFSLTLIGYAAWAINMNLAQIAALNKAKPKIDKGIGLSSNEVAAKKARAQNQDPK